MHTIMITVETENYNHISQDFYNNTINSLDLALIPCTCGHSGCLIHHGVYKRSIQLADTLITLSVIRIYCKEWSYTCSPSFLHGSLFPDSSPAIRQHDYCRWASDWLCLSIGRTGLRWWKQPEIHSQELPSPLVRTVTGGIPLFDRFVQAGFRMFLTLFQAVHAD